MSEVIVGDTVKVKKDKKSKSKHKSHSETVHDENKHAIVPDKTVKEKKKRRHEGDKDEGEAAGTLILR
jgi:hypothetical protein